MAAETPARKKTQEPNTNPTTTLRAEPVQLTVTRARVDKIAVTAAEAVTRTAAEWSLLVRGGGPGGGSGGSTPRGTTSPEVS